MSIRNLDLDEWFSYYQLQYIQRHHFHLSSVIEADLTEVYEAYQGQSFPLSFILIKAMGLLLKHEPGINRQLVHSLTGLKMYEANGCHVNVPVLLNFDGYERISLTVVKDADQKSVADIKSEIKTYLKSRPEDLWLGKYIMDKKNTFFNRFRLKVIHFMVNRFPRFLEQHGVGTGSVSSLLNLEHEGTNVCFMGRGPGAFSLTSSHFDPQTKIVRLGLAWDHHTGKGIDGVGAAISLCKILQNEIAPGSLFPRSDIKS